MRFLFYYINHSNRLIPFVKPFLYLYKGQGLKKSALKDEGIPIATLRTSLTEF